MNRGEARELLMQLLFQMEIQHDYSEELKNKWLENIPKTKNQIDYINGIFSKVTENIDTIDTAINNNSNKWQVSRMPKVDLSILRLAVAEILFEEDIPKEVAINEAVNLAKKYSTEEGGKFINGVLSNF
ncbi:MAG: transcription antitermination factor NusB [Clostridiales bacterium]|nr:transcription antitermination factor NusB [Clostridiales bacterium]